MFHLMELKYSNIVLTIKVIYGFKSTAKGFTLNMKLKLIVHSTFMLVNAIKRYIYDSYKIFKINFL